MIPFSYALYFTGILLSGVYGMYAYVSHSSFLSYLLIGGLVNSYYTLGEYIIHRYFFHDLFHTLHEKHHQDPTRPYRLFIPIKVSLINEGVVLILSLIWCKPYWMAIVSSAHFSYLWFEWAHYGAHYPSSFAACLLPKRMIAFHRHHHSQEDCNYGFTTPYWDRLTGTSATSFSYTQYPLSFLPLSWISFLDVKECVIVGNLVYLYPAYESYRMGLYAYATLYGWVGAMSAVYHAYPSRITRWMDYVSAFLYFLASLSLFIEQDHIGHVEPYVWCISSLLLFLFYDTTAWTHMIWHTMTGIGVGRMIGASRETSF